MRRHRCIAAMARRRSREEGARHPNSEHPHPTSDNPFGSSVTLGHVPLHVMCEADFVDSPLVPVGAWDGEDQVQRKFRCTSGRPHQRLSMKNLGHLPRLASFGLRDIGHRWVIITSGRVDIGSALRLKERTGRIPITTTIAKGGNGTKDIGTTKIMTTAIGVTMIMSEAIVITTTTGMRTATNRHQPNRD